MKTKIGMITLIIALLLAACAPAAAAPEAPAPAQNTQAPAAPAAETPATAAGGENPAPAAPAWFAITITDVNTGSAFTINDLKGKVVLVETMAMWCSNCLKQQKQVKALHDLLGDPEDLVSIGLAIDPNEIGEDLKDYTQGNGFDWVYAVSPAELSRELSNLYGDQFLNPPSTPMLVVDRQGGVHPLPFGIKSADELKSFLEPFLSAGS